MTDVEQPDTNETVETKRSNKHVCPQLVHRQNQSKHLQELVNHQVAEILILIGA